MSALNTARSIHIRPAATGGFDAIVLPPVPWNGADRHGLRTHKAAVRAAASIACVVGFRIVDETSEGGSK